MKARFVSESIDFERGEDPIKALDVGKSRKVRRGDHINVDLQFESGGSPYNQFRDKIWPAIAEDDEKLDSMSGKRELTLRIISDEGYIASGTWIAYFDENKKQWVIE